MARTSISKRQLAVVAYPGVTTLELVGTVSTLSGLGLKTGFRTVVVGERREPLDTDTPARLVSESTFDEVAQPYGLLVPGGGLNTLRAMGDERLLEYIRSVAKNAELVSSVGTGSLLLAAAGLLKGKRATTHWAYRGILENLGATHVEQRWVEDGKFVTSGGTSGGIDMALHLVGRARNERSARQVQLWIEYDPQPPFGSIDRGGADKHALTHILTQHEADLQRWLAHRPDLIEAVTGAIRPHALTSGRP